MITSPERFVDVSLTNDWGQIGRDLCSVGVALVDVAQKQHIPQIAFDNFRAQPWIPTNENTTDSAHFTGPHKAGGLSGRYNQYREGWVFSDGKHPPMVDECQWRLEDHLHEIANHALDAIENELNITPDWFRNHLGPFEDSSQWHMKNYLPPKQNDGETGQVEDRQVWLPSHTDPSLVSVVILDRPGCQPGSQGLSIWQQQNKEWLTVKYSGHSVAIVLTGSLLSHLKVADACKHCVFYHNSQRYRGAATLFVRPRPDALLKSPLENTRKPKTFEEWNRRVARNYEKRKKQDSSRG